jgi:hypothetical protein
MRLSLRSAGGLAVAVLLTLAATLGTGRPGGPSSAFAQNEQKVGNSAGEKTPDSGQAAPRSTDDDREETDERDAARARRSATVFRLLHERPLSSDIGGTPQIEAALEETIAFKIEPQSLREALDLLAKKSRIPILIDEKTIDNASIDLKQEVTLSAPGITLGDTLDLLLSIGADPLSYEIRHGALIVTTLDKVEENFQVAVYDCRDLALIGTLDHDPSAKQSGQRSGAVDGVPMGGGMFQVQQQTAKAPVAAQNAPRKAAAAPVASTPSRNVAQQPAAAEPRGRLPIVQTIMSAIGPDAWEAGATITELGGLVVVRQNRLNHEKIKTLLADIRRMRESGAFASFAKECEAEAKRRAGVAANASAQGLKENSRRGEDAPGK